MLTRRHGSILLSSFVLLFLFHHVAKVSAFTSASGTQPKIGLQQPRGTALVDSYSRRLSLKLVSLSPLMLTSTAPLLSAKECQILIDFFSGKKKVSDEEGAKVLEKLQSTLDEKLMRDPQEGPVRPRFLQYDATLVLKTDDEEDEDTNNTITAADLLPDGLHVDTNNGYLCRYLTVLVYLTSSQSSATTFPLAVPLSSLSFSRNNQDKKTEEIASSKSSALLVQHAQSLLNANIHHTGFSEQNHPSAQVLHEAALDVYARQKKNPQSPSSSNGHRRRRCQHDDTTSTTISTGMRMLPRQGHMVAFWNIDPLTGAPDPYSWHGAEALAKGNTKNVLTFFYEIPIEKIVGGSTNTQASFGAEVGRRKDLILKEYYYDDGRPLMYDGSRHQKQQVVTLTETALGGIR